MSSFATSLALSTALMSVSPSNDFAIARNMDDFSSPDPIIIQDVQEPSQSLREALKKELMLSFGISFTDINGRPWRSSSVTFPNKNDLYQSAISTIEQILPYGPNEHTNLVLDMAPMTSTPELDKILLGSDPLTEETKPFTMQEVRDILIENGQKPADVTDQNVIYSFLSVLSEKVINNVADKIEQDPDADKRQAIFRFLGVKQPSDVTPAPEEQTRSLSF